MAARLRSDSLHPCHHLSEPLRNMFWCRHCMKIFTDPIDRWRHSKTCREAAENEDGAVSKQVSLKEGTLFRFGVWDADPVISRPKSGSASQYGIRIPGSGKVASHKGTVNPQNFELQCVICRQPFQSIDEMRIHVKTPCSKAPDVQNVNRFPPEITNVSPYKHPPVLVREDITRAEDSQSPRISYPKVSSPANSVSKPASRPQKDLFRKSPVAIIPAEPIAELDSLDDPDGLPLSALFSKDSSEPLEIVPEKNFNKLGTVNCSNDVSLVELDGKIPTLQLSPVDISCPQETKQKSALEADSLEFATSNGLKRNSSSDTYTSPVKKSKASITRKPKNVYIKKKTKRKKVVKKKSVKKKEISHESRNEKQSDPMICDHSAELTPNTLKEEFSTTKDEPSDDLNKEDISETQKTAKCPSVKKVLPRKPPRPRKCKICGRIYKSLELLQRHNRLPCTVKLTRNQCAKVLRSNSHTSESGRISQRRNCRQKPAPPKVIPKRRKKKRVKKFPPPFRGNPRLPQYRLVYAELSNKEQFFFKLNMVPTETLTLAADNAVESLQVDMPQLDHELQDLPLLDVGHLFVDDEHVSPPQLVKVSSLDDLPSDESGDDLEPPELEMIIPSTDRHFMDMISPSAEKTLKSVFSPISNSSTYKINNKKKSKQGHISSKARRDRYSILHPIASHKKSHKKKPGQNSTNGNNQSGQRTSQRLKDKALAKMTKEDEEPSNDADSDTDKTKISGTNIESNSHPKTCECKSKDDICPCTSQKADLTKIEPSGVGSPRKNLFESLTDISPENSPTGSPNCSKYSPLNGNQNKLLQNICVAKSRLGKILSPVKSKVSENRVNKDHELRSNDYKSSVEVRCKTSKPKTRVRKHKLSSGESAESRKKAEEPVPVSANQTESNNSESEHKLKLARRTHSRNVSLTENLKYSANVNTVANVVTKPSRQIKLPLLGSRGVPRQTDHSGPNPSLQCKPMLKRKRVAEPIEPKPNVDTTPQSVIVLPQQLTTGLPVPFVKPQDKDLVVSTESNPTSNQVDLTEPSQAVTTVESLLSTPCEETVLPSLVTSYPIADDMQELSSAASQINDQTMVYPPVTQTSNDIPVDVTEKVSVQYINEVHALVDYSDITLIGDECIDTVDQPEGSCTTALDYVEVLDIPNHNVIMETEEDGGTGGDIGLHTIEPQFQTIQFS